MDLKLRLGRIRTLLAAALLNSLILLKGHLCYNTPIAI